MRSFTSSVETTRTSSAALEGAVRENVQARNRLIGENQMDWQAVLAQQAVGELLARAGVRSIQPGIESFSDSVLRLMRKGVTGLQNVQLLKWCRELGLRPYWNLLWGFPGEDPQEYARMAERLVVIAEKLKDRGLARLAALSGAAVLPTLTGGGTP